MWVLADLFHDLPEIGDVDMPKLVFFFDEAHLLFDGASKAFLDAIAQTVRLIRSKGVGIFFVTQSPTDVPDNVLAQLGSRVQHQLRAHTPNDAKALKATVQTYPTSQYDLAETLQSLGIGEAIVTVLNPDGAPTPVAWTRMLAPAGLDGRDARRLAGARASRPRRCRPSTARRSTATPPTRCSPASSRPAPPGHRRRPTPRPRPRSRRRRQREDAAQQRASAPRPTRTSSRPAPRSGVEKVLGSATFWNQVIRVGGQVVAHHVGHSQALKPRSPDLLVPSRRYPSVTPRYPSVTPRYRFAASLPAHG